jgi:beta-N-acetylhexosaminidase
MPAVSSSGADAVHGCRAAIVGVAGPTLEAAERRLLEAADPLGFILFARNCRAPAELRRLIADLRAAVGRADAPVLIDQEGGRVARLCPPHWPARPAARRLGELTERDPAAGREAAWLQARLIASDLAALGITVDCAPVLDLAVPGHTPAIGDRAPAPDPEIVALLGQAAIEGFLHGGVLPVIKHLPGHGRACIDSHHGLPVVDAPRALLAATDWRPFAACRDAPLGMSAHVLYPALDPERPATLSARIIGDVIRGAIGFQGALLSDDLSMGALEGPIGQRAAAALTAGCDLALHCNGRLEEMREVLDAAGPLSGESAMRVGQALAARLSPADFDPLAAQARLDALLMPVAASA